MARVLALSLVAALLAVAPADAAKKRPAPNSGKPGSRCKPKIWNGPAQAPDASLDTTAFGDRAPAAYEIGPPARGGRAERVMMLVHGGAWYAVGPRAMEAERDLARKWRAKGWETLSVTYRACRRSIGDVIRFYDLARERVGPGVPICILGQSAGGHLALMVAARRWDVACVISMAGPSDLRHIGRHAGAQVASGSGSPKLKRGGRLGQGLARAAFGKSRKKLLRASPIGRASKIYARLLLATAADDVLVSYGQDAALAAAIRRARPDAYVDVDTLNPGSGGFIHGSASQAELDQFDERTEAVVRPFGKAPSDNPQPGVPKAKKRLWWFPLSWF